MFSSRVWLSNFIFKCNHLHEWPLVYIVYFAVNLTATCPRGYYCPLGSVHPIQCDRANIKHIISMPEFILKLDYLSDSILTSQHALAIKSEMTYVFIEMDKSSCLMRR